MRGRRVGLRRPPRACRPVAPGGGAVLVPELLVGGGHAGPARGPAAALQALDPVPLEGDPPGVGPLEPAVAPVVLRAAIVVPHAIEPRHATSSPLDTPSGQGVQAAVQPAGPLR